MTSASLLKSSPTPDKSDWIIGQSLRQPSVSSVRCIPTPWPALTIRATSYADELVKTAKTIASPGRGILAMDESNATCGKRLASIGLENTEANRQAYRTLLITIPGLGQYISGAILFEETLYQSTTDGRKMVDVLVEQNIVPGIKVDKGLVPLAGSNNESWCQGLDGLASRSAAYYQQGAHFAKWRTVVSIPNGPSALAIKEAAWGLARYAAISQDNGLVPIVEPEILLDGDHGIDRTFEVAHLPSPLIPPQLSTFLQLKQPADPSLAKAVPPFASINSSIIHNSVHDPCSSTPRSDRDIGVTMKLFF